MDIALVFGNWHHNSIFDNHTTIITFRHSKQIRCNKYLITIRYINNSQFKLSFHNKLNNISLFHLRINYSSSKPSRSVYIHRIKCNYSYLIINKSLINTDYFKLCILIIVLKYTVFIVDFHSTNDYT